MTAQDILSRIRDGITLCGTYAFFDKGAQETVIDYEKIIAHLKNDNPMPAALLKELQRLGAASGMSKEVDHFISDALVSLQDISDEKWSYLMADFEDLF